MRCLLSISLLAASALGMPRERIKVNNISIISDASVAPKSQLEIQESAMPQQPSEIPDHQFSQIVRNAFKRPPPTNIDSILEEPSEFAAGSNAADQLDDSVQNIELAGIEFPLTEVQLLDLEDDSDLASEADVSLTGTAEVGTYFFSTSKTTDFSNSTQTQTSQPASSSVQSSGSASTFSTEAQTTAAPVSSSETATKPSSVLFSLLSSLIEFVPTAILREYSNLLSSPLETSSALVSLSTSAPAPAPAPTLTAIPLSTASSFPITASYPTVTPAHEPYLTPAPAPVSTSAQSSKNSALVTKHTSTKEYGIASVSSTEAAQVSTVPNTSAYEYVYTYQHLATPGHSAGPSLSDFEAYTYVLVNSAGTSASSSTATIFSQSSASVSAESVAIYSAIEAILKPGSLYTSTSPQSPAPSTMECTTTTFLSAPPLPTSSESCDAVYHSAPEFITISLAAIQEHSSSCPTHQVVVAATPYFTVSTTCSDAASAFASAFASTGPIYGAIANIKPSVTNDISGHHTVKPRPSSTSSYKRKHKHRKVHSHTYMSSAPNYILIKSALRGLRVAAPTITMLSTVGRKKYESTTKGDFMGYEPPTYPTPTAQLEILITPVPTASYAPLYLIKGPYYTHGSSSSRGSKHSRKGHHHKKTSSDKPIQTYALSYEEANTISMAIGYRRKVSYIESHRANGRLVHKSPLASVASDKADAA